MPFAVLCCLQIDCDSSIRCDFFVSKGREPSRPRSADFVGAFQSLETHPPPLPANHMPRPTPTRPDAAAPRAAFRNESGDSALARAKLVDVLTSILPGRPTPLLASLQAWMKECLGLGFICNHIIQKTEPTCNILALVSSSRRTRIVHHLAKTLFERGRKDNVPIFFQARSEWVAVVKNQEKPQFTSTAVSGGDPIVD